MLGLRQGSNGLRNTVVVIRIRDPIIRLIFQKRIALLLAFACWLDASFRLDSTVSSVAAVRCSLIQGRVFVLRSLGGTFSLPTTATLRAFFIAHRRSQCDFSCRWGATSPHPQPLLPGNLLSGRHQTLPVVTALSRSSLDFPRCHRPVPVVDKVNTYNMQQQLPRHHPRQPPTRVG